ncbi:hypothetical protein I7I51_00460 [Histoplasma capsulatum]|uniref:Uncharacterized protein n=1 Tax=Ajellomyces capsulatus TaxID=5037 RepID=A0A8A1MFR8_AJECA|nr:hypothetical protein I7I51_00460 [Histoplasma capsulatum]
MPVDTEVMIHEENDDDFHQGNGREFQTFPYSTISISNRDEKEGLLVWESQKYATPDNASIVISAAGPDVRTGQTSSVFPYHLFRNDESLKPRSREQPAEVDESRYEITISGGLKKRCHKVGKVHTATVCLGRPGLGRALKTLSSVPRQQQAHKCDQETNLEVVKTFLGPGDPVETSLCPYASLAHPWGDRITSRDCV